jgi:hypothetical protein
VGPAIAAQTALEESLKNRVVLAGQGAGHARENLACALGGEHDVTLYDRLSLPGTS